jgi:CDP-glucose 4,6-dehydratase
MSQFAGFYRGKRVLVTGHTGFIGGWLVAWLKLLGARVCGYGLPPTSRPNFFDAILLDRGITSVFADVRDRETLANTFADFQPEVVFHTAHARRSNQDPLEIFTTNANGTINLLEEARLTGSVRAIVLVGDSESAAATSEARDKEPRSISDWHRASRAVAGSAALAFAGSFFAGSRTKMAAAHFPTLIGGGDWSAAGLVPGLMHAVGLGEPFAISSDVFHCCHVLDAACACLNLGEEHYASSSPAGAAWNFTSAVLEPISEVEFAKQLIEQLPGIGVEIRVIESQARPPASLRTETPLFPDWRPSLRLVQVIAWTASWYKAYLADPLSAWRTTEAQIEEYENLVHHTISVQEPNA